MKFTTLLTIIIVGYVIYYAYQIIHDLFFTKGVLSDELHIEEEVDITGEVKKYQPVRVSREDIGTGESWEYRTQRRYETLRIRPIPYGINMKNTQSPL